MKLKANFRLTAVAALFASSATFASPLQDVIVSLNPQVNDVVAAVSADYGVTTKYRYSRVFQGFAASLPDTVVAQLRQDPRVLSISNDATVRTIGNPDGIANVGCGLLFNCDSNSQVTPWGIARIAADNAINDGQGTHVYVIDTGIDSDHPDLVDNLGNGYAVEMCLGLNCRSIWDDDQGHGTHVAGTIGAVDNDIDVVGVAPKVTLHGVKVLNAAGSGSNSGVIAGIDWVAGQAETLGTTVIANMSLGGDGSKTGQCSPEGFSGSDNFHRAVCNAKNLGVIFAVAAGNDGKDATGATPAAYDDAVITVAATNEQDDWPSWSNWGNDSAQWSAHASAPVAIAAPGADILSTQFGGGTTSMSGTSMASPHVAGVLALFVTNYSTVNDGSAFEQARSWLLDNAESTGSFNNTSGNPHQEGSLRADKP